ncbi:ribosome maturation factor RimM [Dictyobacter arantiisoli]|uniref:Ribosome maturation factor RimM n=1 Tax=Dictyobacter arantiisoli TaxID=2014874 RepID=A0A5A5TDE5_9CHLR|nr:ribosome maturation factor RimM [Dictyobacter arantiisoli]GCF09377.1 ribosome maturation factor RimM [Dictyobacter arantiisoli]
MKNTTEWATIGKIVAPFGIRGEVKVFSLSDVPDRFASLKAIYLAPDYKRYTIRAVRPHKGDMLLLKFAGVNDTNTAETLRGRDVCIPTEQLATLPPDSYYQHDILGLQVLLLNNQEVGVITDIWTTAGNDVYVLKSPTGKQVLIPAIKDVIKQIDLIRRVMYIDPMKGLLDDDAVIDDPNDKSEQEDDE